MNHHLADLGWVDFALDVLVILPTCSAYSAKLSSAQAEFVRQWNGQNQGQPNSGTRGDGSPCIYLDFNQGLYILLITKDGPDGVKVYLDFND